MSMELMVKAMKIKVGNPLRKLVLLKLADNANDQGECWPSYQHIADQCEISRSSVKAHIRWLEKEGFVIREFRRNGDANQSNLFHLRLWQELPEGGQELPEGGQELPEGGQELPEGGAGAARGGGAGAAPRTSHSFEPVIEPVKEPIRSAKAPRKSRANVVGLLSLKKMAAESWPSIPDDQILGDWLKVRKQHRAAITQTAINGMGRELHKAVSAGHTVEQCLQLAVERGWRGFRAEWISNAGSGSGTGKPGYFRGNQPTDYWEGVDEDGKF